MNKTYLFIGSKFLRSSKKGFFVILTTVLFLSGFFVANSALALNSITVNSPNEGEYLSGIQDITWTADCVEGDAVNIYYSTDDFVNQSVKIDGNLTCSDGSYSWNTTGVNDGDYKIRVTDSNDPHVYDTSGFFTVDNTSPAIQTTTLTSPNGDENWAGDSNQTISWTAGDITDTNLGTNSIGFYYTTDGDVWNTIAENQTNSGSYPWTIPTINSATVKVKIVVTDLASNTASDESNAVFTIDSIYPTATVIVSVDSITDSSLEQTITVTYSESMDVNTEPIITITGLVSSYNVTGGTWSKITNDNDTYTVIQVINDNNEETIATVEVSGAVDLAGNTQEPNNTETFEVDTKNPTVVSAVASPDPAKDGTVTVTITFSEEMDTNTSPIIQITGITGSPIVNQTSYVDDTWTGTFTLVDNDEEKPATISVTGGVDLVGNVMDDNLAAGTFVVDTIDPTVSLISQSTALITDTTNSFMVTVDYSEAMDQSLAPTVSFSLDVSSTLTLASGSWSDSDTYIATYDVVDADVEMDDVDIFVMGATDPAGNEQEAGSLIDAFDIDTKNPTVELTDDQIEDNIVRDADTVVITAVFIEANEINETVAPKITIGTVVTGAIMTEVDDTNLQWTYTWDVPAGNDGIADVSITATDMAGNSNAAATGEVSYTIDNISPMVELTYNPNRPVRDADTVEITATFNEPMASAPTVAIDTTETDLVATAMSGNGTVWTYQHDVPTGSDGNATVMISGTDIAGNPNETATNNTFIIDNIAPVITLLGQVTVEIETGEEYTDAGATVDETVEVTTSGSVNNSIVGEYILTYNAVDLAGNTAESKIRTVNVVAPTLINMTASDVSQKQDLEFIVEINSKGNVRDSQNDHLVRFYGVIPGLTANEITFLGSNIPAVVTDSTERGYAGADTDDLVLAWGPEGGFPIGDAESAYESEGGLSTTFNAMVSKQADYAISFKMYDFTKNAVPATGSASLNITDGVAPTGYTVTIDQSYINNSNQTALSFIFANAEVDATYNYSIDSSGGGTTVTSNGIITATNQQIIGINVAGLNDGTLTLTVYLTDQADNQGNTVTDAVVKDIVAPTTSDDYVSKDDIWQNTDQTITLTPVDTTSGVVTTKYCTDTENNCDPANDYTQAVMINTEGITYFRYTSTDNAGNVQETVSRTVKIDETAPVTTDDVPLGWQTADVTVTLTCDDSIGGNSGCLKVYYTTDDSDPTTASFFVDAGSSWQFTVSIDGDYTVKYRGEDVVGNLEAVKTAANSLQLDKTAPDITNFSPSDGSITSDTTPTISADFTETGSGIDISSVIITVNDTDVTVFATIDTNSVSYTPGSAMSNGIKTVTLGVSDVTGNAASQSSWSFEVAATVASVSVTIDKSSLMADGSTQVKITALVLDSGTLVTSGNVVFATVIGTLTSASVDLDASGKAITYLTSNEVGETTVTASYNGPSGLVSGTVNVTFTATPKTISVVSSLSSVPADGVTQSTITVTILDNNNPIDGGTVNFSTNLGVLISNSEVSNVDGEASVTITSSAIGLATIIISYNTGDETISDTAEVDFTGEVTTYNIPLSTGWNLISLPLIPENTTIENVLADINGDVDIVWYYNANAGSWLNYKPEIGGNLTTMEDGKGYWIFMNNTDTLTIIGSEMPAGGPEEPTSYSVVGNKWNLIGFKSVISMPVKNYITQIGNNDVLWVYKKYENEENEEYVLVHPSGTNSMESGYGYWLYPYDGYSIVPTD